jgi:hypothetical protein
MDGCRKVPRAEAGLLIPSKPAATSANSWGFPIADEERHGSRGVPLRSRSVMEDASGLCSSSAGGCNHSTRTIHEHVHRVMRKPQLLLLAAICLVAIAVYLIANLGTSPTVARSLEEGVSVLGREGVPPSPPEEGGAQPRNFHRRHGPRPSPTLRWPEERVRTSARVPGSRSTRRTWFVSTSGRSTSSC